MFVDMNSYFASVEQHLCPELRGRPVGVVPVESDYTSIIAASYQAKKFGIKTGTRVKDAKVMCPGIVLVRARPQIYVQVHHSILRSVDRCAPVHKVYSIDEWAIRLIGREQEPANAQHIARQIKGQLLTDFGPCLTCSIGIAPSRLLAKIASDLQKPDGLTLLSTDDMPAQLENMTLTDLCGIGQGMLTRLNAHGVWTIADLWALTRQQAINAWGSVSGAHWWAGFHGIDEPEQRTRHRSITHSSVLHPRFRNEEGAHGILVRLLCKLGVRLRYDGYFARQMRVYINPLDGGVWHREASLPCVQDTPTLLDQFHKLWHQRPPGVRPLKVGIDLADLVPASQVADSLFEVIEKPRRLSNMVDKINQRWGASTVYFGPIHDFRQPMDDKIAFGRIPPVVQ